MTEKVFQGIEVALAEGGKRIRIVVEQTVGAFAIHMRIREQLAIGPGYTISDIAGGYAVWHVEHLNDAVRVAQLLAKALPEGKEMMPWWSALTQDERTKYVQAMSAIAPKYKPEGE